MEDYMKIYQKQYSNHYAYALSSYKGLKIEKIDGKNTCMVDIKSGDTTHTHVFEGYSIIRYKTDTGKLFTYTIGFLDDNVSTFKAATFFKDRQLPYDGKQIEMLKSNISLLESTSRVSYRDKSTISLIRIIIAAELDKGVVTVKFNPEFVKFIQDLYFWVPKPLFSTRDKLYPHAWSIGYEIYLQMMQNHRSGEFNLNIGRLIDISPFNPRIKLEKKKRLYEPFKRNCEYLNQLIPSLNITVPEYTRAFQNNSISIKITDKGLIESYNSNSIKNNIIELRTDAKIDNIKRARQLKSEGFTIKKIAETLKVSTRTIDRYIKGGK